MLIYNKNLTSQQKKDLAHLQSQCLEQDHALPFFYTEILSNPRSFDSHFLYYADNLLVGFLTFYLFYSEGCEVALIVSPRYRHQGIAHQLLKAALPFMKKMGCRDLVFSKPEYPVHEKWFAFYRDKGYDYLMGLDNINGLPAAKKKLNLQKANPNNIADLCCLHTLCFDESSDMTQRFQDLFSNKSYYVLIALHEQKIIGKSHFLLTPSEIILSDFAIHPDYQHQGYGQAFLIHCLKWMNTIVSLPFILTVNSDNATAKLLYQKAGFSIQQCVHYWSISVDDLTQHVL